MTGRAFRPIRLERLQDVQQPDAALCRRTIKGRVGYWIVGQAAYAELGALA
jgi:hypothetical protein